MKYADVHAYLRSLIPGSDRTLRAMEQYARSHNFPIVGPLVGRYLYQTAIVSRARKVLELGSGFGYSAYWFSLAMGRRGRITMIDGDPANRERALAYLARGGLESKFSFIVDDALVAAAKLSGPFDIVFNDIDKHGYPETIETAARLLKPGGVFITDNIIWSGRVLTPAARDANTRGVMTFTRRLYADDRFFTTIIPIRDGLAVAVKR